VGPDLTLGGKHFVEKIAGLVFVEQSHESRRGEAGSVVKQSEGDGVGS
jgi:hypothetical protein